MDLERLLVDLDGVRWADVDHAYGEADDLPGMLRALAGDEERAREALDELWSSILHQGTVYSATVTAVPFLARLAAAGVRSDDLLVLLGGIADSRDEYGLPAPGACRSAVADQLPLILPLFASEDPEVRRAAVWAAGRTGATAALPALRRHWDGGREEPAVRAELLAALARIDPSVGAEAAAGVLAPGPDASEGPDAPAGPAAASRADASVEHTGPAGPTASAGRIEPAGPAGPTASAGRTGSAEPAAVVRIVAVLTCLDLGLPWTSAHRDALVSLLPAGPRVADLFDPSRAEPLHYAVDALLLRDTGQDREAAHRLIEAALRLPDPEARREALWAAEHACVISRGAPLRLAPALLALLADPTFTDPAPMLPVLAALGRHAAPAAPVLTALAESAGERADRALEVLLRIAPEQAGPLLARDLDGRPRTLRAVTGLPGRRPALPVPYAPELLNAIRIRLSGIAGQDDSLADCPAALLELLLSWGPRASAALPELAAAFERRPARIAPALAAVCPPESRERTAGLLRRAAESAEGDTAGRFAAARALRTLTGESDPLVGVLQEALTSEDADPELPRAAGELGCDGEVLIPRLREALTPQGAGRTVADLRADLETALALWRLTGEAAEPVKVLEGVIAEAADGEWTRLPLTEAVRAAALIGPAAAALAPALEALLDRPDQAPCALLALSAVGRAADRTRAAELLLTSAEHALEWSTALDALAALGPEALTHETTARLTALADGDLRVVASGPGPDLIDADERLRARAREVLTAAR
ncbi:HEAT repeat domain-containing protein [Streptomyces sp. NPDC014894]|uniref:HEAT repeat domain-containing protein n=1 Tax=Streptomyces sp. NPDC014894 TaxID=3364931 RepID=UPI0036FC230D